MKCNEKSGIFGVFGTFRRTFVVKIYIQNRPAVDASGQRDLLLFYGILYTHIMMRLISNICVCFCSLQFTRKPSSHSSHFQNIQLFDFLKNQFHPSILYCSVKNEVKVNQQQRKLFSLVCTKCSNN